MLGGNVGRKRTGILLLNDCKHGHSLEGNTFRLSLIRSGYDPDPLPDIGQHEIHLALMPFAAMTAPDAIAEGKAFNRPLRLTTASLHKGDLPPIASAAKVTPASMLLSEIKRAEDGAGLVLRLVNPTGRPAKASIALSPALLGKFRKAAEVDLMERPTPGNSARFAGAKLSVTVPANAIASVKLTA
jgi:alpha-mannosidase